MYTNNKFMNVSCYVDLKIFMFMIFYCCFFDLFDNKQIKVNRFKSNSSRTIVICFPLRWTCTISFLFPNPLILRCPTFMFQKISCFWPKIFSSAKKEKNKNLNCIFICAKWGQILLDLKYWRSILSPFDYFFRCQLWWLLSCLQLSF